MSDTAPTTLPPHDQFFPDVIGRGCHFLERLKEAGLVLGVEPPPLSEKFAVVRFAMVFPAWSEWEYSLNPHLSKVAGPCINPRVWKLPVLLFEALAELYTVREDLIRHWGLEPAIGQSSFNFNICGTSEKVEEHLPSPRQGPAPLVKPHGWPPPNPLKLFRRAEYCLYRISELYHVWTLSMAPAQNGSGGDHKTEWSLSHAPSFWAKVFNCSSKTIPDLFAEQTIPNKKLSTRAYMVDMAYIPETWKDKAGKPKTPPLK
jgi:hypothetical protein